MAKTRSKNCHPPNLYYPLVENVPLSINNAEQNNITSNDLQQPHQRPPTPNPRLHKLCLSKCTWPGTLHNKSIGCYRWPPLFLLQGPMILTQEVPKFKGKIMNTKHTANPEGRNPHFHVWVHLKIPNTKGTGSQHQQETWAKNKKFEIYGRKLMTKMQYTRKKLSNESW